ncbi:MAG: sensor histidine kinase [Bacteroidales bacterium]|nr:sensor histidine kinase [Bacteroidales bacterium]
MKKLIRYFLLTVALSAGVEVAAKSNADQLDATLLGRTDGLCKEAFLLRYKNPAKGVKCGQLALRLIEDSLPRYYDGRLRAWNTLALNYYMQSQHDSAWIFLNKVLSCERRSENLNIEQVIAQLLEARLHQRACRIADSYAILYKVEHSRMLRKKRGNFLYDFARMEYYITSLTLNYYYRGNQAQQLKQQLEDIEKERAQLRCDYAQDMAFNYALAYGYMVQCDNQEEQSLALRKALDYCDENFHLLSDSNNYTIYFMANTLQLLASIVNRPSVTDTSWMLRGNRQHLQEMIERLCSVFDFCTTPGEDYVRALYEESTALFWQTPDRYQRLGSVSATANYLRQKGNEKAAHQYYSLVLADSTLWVGIAPRFEASIYRGLLESRYTDDAHLQTLWLKKELDLLDYIKQNERADFELQNKLMRTTSQNRWMWLMLALGTAALAGVSVLTLKLKRRTQALHHEKAELETAKQKDVERIANVETCLSVLRHDVNPFVSYLQRPNLPEEMRTEVVEQLLRTFQNIKSWTNLSIPSGLKFRGSTVPLQDVFDTTALGIGKFQNPAVELHFVETPLTVQGDSQLLEILLRNLVNNALQHTQEGSVTISAEVFKDDGRFVLVSVADTGCGMAPQEVEELFRADKKPKSNSEERETSNGHCGFGLILCRYIIKKHDDNTLRGCRIWAESEPGTGTTMKFLIMNSNP